jgi:Acetyltransferases, including N-acetylases of ribosomal proteins
MLELQRIYASHSTNNPASGHILQKVGMRPEGTLRRHVLKWGEYLDLELFALLASDYRTNS